MVVNSTSLFSVAMALRNPGVVSFVRTHASGTSVGSVWDVRLTSTAALDSGAGHPRARPGWHASNCTEAMP